MASLKEIKRRIASVRSTRKITQARQLVSSAQLHRTQGILGKATAYKQAIDGVLADIGAVEADTSSPLLGQRAEGPVAVVMMASDSGMCGSFNAKMEKELLTLPGLYPERELLYFPIGKKMREAVVRQGLKAEEEPELPPGRVSFEEARAFSGQLIQLFLSRRVSRVEMVYYRFKTVSIQPIVRETLLPCTLPAGETGRPTVDIDDYILEPSRGELIDTLVEMSIHADFYAALTNNQTSEHATRMIAMQIAGENADDLLAELQTTFNKLRQNTITNDLLDISNSSFA